MEFAIIVGAVITLVLLYVIIRTAVEHALTSHYKRVRLFEATGEWVPGHQGTKQPRKLADNSPVR